MAIVLQSTGAMPTWPNLARLQIWSLVQPTTGSSHTSLPGLESMLACRDGGPGGMRGHAAGQQGPERVSCWWCLLWAVDSVLQPRGGPCGGCHRFRPLCGWTAACCGAAARCAAVWSRVLRPRCRGWGVYQDSFRRGSRGVCAVLLVFGRCGSWRCLCGALPNHALSDQSPNPSSWQRACMACLPRRSPWRGCSPAPRATEERSVHNNLRLPAWRLRLNNTALAGPNFEALSMMIDPSASAEQLIEAPCILTPEFSAGSAKKQRHC